MRAELPRRGGLPIKRAREIASGTDGLWTLLWRERDSNSRSLWRGKLLPAEEKGPEVDQGGLERPVPSRAGPVVRIPLPPAKSQPRTRSRFKRPSCMGSGR
jgi:hypothetical protein